MRRVFARIGGDSPDSGRIASTIPDKLSQAAALPAAVASRSRETLDLEVCSRLEAGGSSASRLIRHEPQLSLIGGVV